MDWAKHRRRKAAAKMHLRLGRHSFLPSFAIVGAAREHDNKRAPEGCASLQPEEIVESAHLFDLGLRRTEFGRSPAPRTI